MTGVIAVFRLPLALATILMIGTTVPSAIAQTTQSGTPGVITEGSSNTSIGGAAAARTGDRTTNSSAVQQGSSNVFINGRPAVTTGDKTSCGGLVVGGGSNVFINGKPVARAGDMTTGCPKK